MDSASRDDASPPLRRGLISDALRRYGTDATRIGHIYASDNGLQFVDLQALVAIMAAESAGTPLTPGRLTEHLGLSSGGTSYVIDRLVASGHVRRCRDHPTDHRIVHLRHTEAGQATGRAFFGSLAQRTDAILDQFEDSELETIERFIGLLAQSMHDHLAELEDRSP